MHEISKMEVKETRLGRGEALGPEAREVERF